MAELFVTEISGPAGPSTEFVSGINTNGAKSRIKAFSYTFAGASIGDTLVLALLPPNARLLRGVLNGAALGGSTTLAVGTGTGLTQPGGAAIAASNANLKAAAATSSVFTTPFAATLALGAGATTTGRQQTKVYATLAGGAATGLVAGWVEYAQN